MATATPTCSQRAWEPPVLTPESRKHGQGLGDDSGPFFFAGRRTGAPHARHGPDTTPLLYEGLDTHTPPGYDLTLTA